MQLRSRRVEPPSEPPPSKVKPLAPPSNSPAEPPPNQTESDDIDSNGEHSRLVPPTQGGLVVHESLAEGRREVGMSGGGASADPTPNTAEVGGGSPAGVRPKPIAASTPNFDLDQSSSPDTTTSGELLVQEGRGVSPSDRSSPVPLPLPLPLSPNVCSNSLTHSLTHSLSLTRP